jgi:hypothetical protein
MSAMLALLLASVDAQTLVAGACEPCGVVSEAAFFGCDTGLTTHAMPVVAPAPHAGRVTAVVFDLDTFISNSGTVNIYCRPSIDAPPSALFDTPLLSVPFTADSVMDGGCVRVPFDEELVLPSPCPVVWIEIIAASVLVRTSPNCGNGGSTWVTAPGCGFATPTLAASSDDIEIYDVPVALEVPLCADGMLNHDEEAIDCGGPNCPACNCCLLFELLSGRLTLFLLVGSNNFANIVLFVVVYCCKILKRQHSYLQRWHSESRRGGDRLWRPELSSL